MKVLRIIFNKYLLTVVAFIVLLIFFDQADWISQKKRQRELQKVEDNISYLKTEIDKMDTQYKAIRTDPQALERYAREQYRMKRDTEDLYIIEQK